MEFNFATANRIVFGPGTLVEAAAFAESRPGRFFVVTGGTAARAKPLLVELDRRGVSYHTYNIGMEMAL